MIAEFEKNEYRMKMNTHTPSDSEGYSTGPTRYSVRCEWGPRNHEEYMQLVKSYYG